MPEYIWANRFKNFHYKEVEAQVFGDRIESLRAELGDAITPVDVVEDARPPDSPTHSLFTWNDSQAAEKWRHHQARNMIDSVHVVISYKEMTPVTGAYNQRVTITYSNGTRDGAYVPHVLALSSPIWRAQIIKEAHQGLRRWARRYSELRDEPSLAQAFEAIGSAEEVKV
jgi:hypothetical protein|tara:strand:- start:717 stop:1226 length:510 start_codon:yes stop_codon:yes gene_type:complete